jgi:hypothetical protein
LTAIVIGQALFGEHIDHSQPAVVGEVLGLVLMIVGVSQLCRRLMPTAGPSPELDEVRSLPVR